MMWILGGAWQYIIFRCTRRYHPNCASFWQRVPIVAIPTRSTARQHRVNQIMLKRERHRGRERDTHTEGERERERERGRVRARVDERGIKLFNRVDE